MILEACTSNIALHQGTESNFDDITGQEWYANYINFALEKDIIQGYQFEGLKLFSPQTPLTKAEAIKILEYSVTKI